jgi:hypothetical protein
MTTGHVIWQGASLLDAAPIMAIALKASANVKTGNMVQTYILRQDMHPAEAVASGADVSVCGECAWRPSRGGACYVLVDRGPAVVYKKWRRGGYPLHEDPSVLGEGRMVRLGSYGDPMAVPARVWQALVSKAAGHTGYTHQWQNRDLPLEQWQGVTELCMASVDSDAEATLAQTLGLRYFRVRTPKAGAGVREMVCPASEEAGKRLTCIACGACNGTADGRSNRASVVITVHGRKARKFAAPRLFSRAKE